MSAPLNRWELVDSFLAEKECQDAVLNLRMDAAAGDHGPGQAEVASRFRAARCVRITVFPAGDAYY